MDLNMSNSYICSSHPNNASHFCLCKSNPIFLCSACLPKHTNHNYFSIDHIQIYRIIGKEELKRRKGIWDNCNSFLERMRTREAVMYSEAQSLLTSLMRSCEYVITENHRCFEAVVESLNEEIGIILVSAEYQMSAFSQFFIEKAGNLKTVNVEKLVAAPHWEEMREMAEKCEKAGRRTRKMWQESYEEVLRKAISSTSQSISTEKQSVIEEIEGPVPNYINAEAQKALEKFGAYVGTDMESTLIKRGPVAWKGGVYTGQWNIRNQRHGYGVFSYSNGSIYEGEWRYDLRHGKGRCIWSNGDMYIGDWEQDKKIGFGKHFWTPGDSYSGEYVNDKKQGEGCYRYANGKVYYGEYLEGKRTGRGCLFSSNGTMEMGVYEADKLNGKGIGLFGDGSIYSGEFTNGNRNGLGSYFSLAGGLYHGEWRDGKQHGIGKYANPGDIVVGPYTDGKRHGDFEVKPVTGSSYHCRYENGVLKQRLP